MVVTKTEFNKAMKEINTSYSLMQARIDALDKRLAKLEPQKRVKAARKEPVVPIEDRSVAA